MFSTHTKRIILWSFILHTIWEFVQCVFLYEMWDCPFWKATIWMWAAIFGDILIVLVLWKGTTLLARSIRFESPGGKGYRTLLMLSFLASIFSNRLQFILTSGSTHQPCQWLQFLIMPLVFHRFCRQHSCRHGVYTWQTGFTLTLNHRYQSGIISLVRAYLQLNGYFVVTEYPLEELGGQKK